MYTKIIRKKIRVRLLAPVFLAAIMIPFIGVSQVMAGYLPPPTQTLDASWTNLTSAQAIIPIAENGLYSVPPYKATFNKLSMNGGQMTLGITQSDVTAIDNILKPTQVEPQLCGQNIQIQIGNPNVPNSYETANTYSLTEWFDAPLIAPCGSLGNTKNYTGTFNNTWVSANFDASWTSTGDMSWNYTGWSSTFAPQSNTTPGQSITLTSSKKVTTCSQDTGSSITVGDSSTDYQNATTAIWSIRNPEQCGSTEDIFLALANPYNQTPASDGSWISTTTIAYQNTDYSGTVPASGSKTMTLTNTNTTAPECGYRDQIIVGDPNGSANNWESTQGLTGQPAVVLQTYSSSSGLANICQPNSPTQITLINTWQGIALGLPSTAVWSSSNNLTYNNAVFTGSLVNGGMTLSGTTEPPTFPSISKPTTCTTGSTIQVSFNAVSDYAATNFPATLTAYNPTNGCAAIAIPITINNAFCDFNSGNPNCSAAAQAGGGSSGCPITDGDALEWLLCPVATIAQDTITKVLSPALENFLYTPNNFFTNSGFQQTSATFRDIGIALLVIAGLAMVLSQAAGMEVFAAYTIRKALPRLIIAMIAMALVDPILQFIVTFFNDIGSWIQQLILIAGGGGTGSPSTLWTSIFSPVGVIGGIGLFLTGAAIIISLLLTILLALLVAFLVLTIRQLVILVCIIIAPLAIAAAVLPGTERIWKFWRETVLTSLAMFPIIMGFLGAGIALSQIAGSEAASSKDISWDIMAVIALIAPLVMLPFTFIIAGGLVSTIHRAVGGRSQGVFAGLSKQRSTIRAQRNAAWRTGSLYSNRGIGGALNNLGRRVNVGAKGRFGVGSTGKTAIALADASNVENTLKNNPLLTQLANMDDGNAVMALSGGTRAGAWLAARQLFFEKDDNGNFKLDENGNRIVDETRARNAYNQASAVGFNRANATAALSTLAQNKSRSIEAGEIDVVQAGITRLAGNNYDLRDNLSYGFQFLSRQAGRADLGGTWHTKGIHDAAEGLLARAEARGHRADEKEATSVATTLDGLGRTNIGSIVSGHSSGVKQALKTIHYVMENGDYNQRVTAGQRLLELQSALPYASGDNQAIINEALREYKYVPGAPQASLAEQISARVSLLNQQHNVTNKEGSNRVEAFTLSSGARAYGQEQYRRPGTEGVPDITGPPVV